MSLFFAFLKLIVNILFINKLTSYSLNRWLLLRRIESNVTLFIELISDLFINSEIWATRFHFSIKFKLSICCAFASNSKNVEIYLEVPTKLKLWNAEILIRSIFVLRIFLLVRIIVARCVSQATRSCNERKDSKCFCSYRKTMSELQLFGTIDAKKWK